MGRLGVHCRRGLHLCADQRVVAFALVLGGCILPVSPEFEDPEPNLSPYVVNATPPINSVVGENQKIEVTLADPNPGDTLYLRWVFNYPEFTAASRFSLSGMLSPSLGRGEVRTPVARIEPTCFRDFVGAPDHRVMLIVSDRPFDDASAPTNLPFDNVKPEARVLRATWLVRKTCR